MYLTLLAPSANSRKQYGSGITAYEYSYALEQGNVFGVSHPLFAACYVIDNRTPARPATGRCLEYSYVRSRCWKQECHERNRSTSLSRWVDIWSSSVRPYEYCRDICCVSFAFQPYIHADLEINQNLYAHVRYSISTVLMAASGHWPTGLTI